MFHPEMCAAMQIYAAHPPSDDERWHMLWFSMLGTLFPSSQNYFRQACPPPGISKEDRARDPSIPLHIEVLKLITVNPSPSFRTVLFIEIRSPSHWEAGIPALQERITSRANDTFSRGEAVSKLYWICTIGLRWRYGIKYDDGRDAEPLIPWHDTVQDQASYDDLQNLVALVAAM